MCACLVIIFHSSFTVFSFTTWVLNVPVTSPDLCILVCACVYVRVCVYWCYTPIARAGHQDAKKVVDDEGEDDGCDGATGDGVAGILQVTC